MTTPFVASNGTVIARKGRASLAVERPGTDRLLNINADRTEALREFFRAEHDEELGRWRWPENPDYVVYPKSSSETEPSPGVRVVHESSGRSKDVGRVVASACEAAVSVFGKAACAYFAANPERKPWHDAKSGEAWALTVDGEEYPWGVGDGVDAGRFVYLGGLTNIPLDHPSITAGRRLWPEDAS